VNEYVTAALAFDEPVTLGVVEPLDLACDAHRSSSLLTERLTPRGGFDRIACVPTPMRSFGAQKKTASACAASTATPRVCPSA
jgi:hypothetical protein